MKITFEIETQGASGISVADALVLARLLGATDADIAAAAPPAAAPAPAPAAPKPKAVKKETPAAKKKRLAAEKKAAAKKAAPAPAPSPGPSVGVVGEGHPSVAAQERATDADLTAPEEVDPLEDALPEFSADDLKALVKLTITRTDVDKVKAVFAEHGASRISDLKVDAYPSVKAALEAL